MSRIEAQEVADSIPAHGYYDTLCAVWSRGMLKSPSSSPSSTVYHKLLLFFALDAMCVVGYRVECVLGF